MKKREIDWPVVLFLSGYHLLLVVLMPAYLLSRGLPGWKLIAATLILSIICGLSITAGYHRFYSHLTYKLNKVVEFFLMIVGTLAFASTALKWAYDHRLHHRYVDTERDPYNIKQGFWHAHILWLFYKRSTWDDRIVKDLLKNRMVVFQDTHYLPLVITANVLQIAVIGWLVGDYFGAFVFTFLLRTFFLHHTMYAINSLAHYYGSQPYSNEHTAVNNWLISFVTFGEGYHNFHHTFASDYRNGIRWYQFDPSKMLIWTLSKLGLASDLKSTDRYRIYQTMIKQDEKLILEQIKDERSLAPDLRDKLVQDVTVRAQALITQSKQLGDRVKAFSKLKKDELSSVAEVTKLKESVAEMKLQRKADMARWGRICKQYLVDRSFQPVE